MDMHLTVSHILQVTVMFWLASRFYCYFFSVHHVLSRIFKILEAILSTSRVWLAQTSCCMLVWHHVNWNRSRTARALSSVPRRTGSPIHLQGPSRGHTFEEKEVLDSGELDLRDLDASLAKPINQSITYDEALSVSVELALIIRPRDQRRQRHHLERPQA